MGRGLRGASETESKRHLRIIHSSETAHATERDGGRKEGREVCEKQNSAIVGFSFRSDPLLCGNRARENRRSQQAELGGNNIFACGAFHFVQEIEFGGCEA